MQPRPVSSTFVQLEVDSLDELLASSSSSIAESDVRALPQRATPVAAVHDRGSLATPPTLVSRQPPPVAAANGGASPRTPSTSSSSRNNAEMQRRITAGAGAIHQAFASHWEHQCSQMKRFMWAAVSQLPPSLQLRHRRLVNRENWVPPGFQEPPEYHENDVLIPSAILPNTDAPTPSLVLRRHQVDGIRFMWDRLATVPMLAGTDENGNRIPVPGTGCILAHSMGLGKTCQVIAILHALSHHLIAGMRVLLLAPKSVLPSWASEIAKWAKWFPIAVPLSVFDDTMKRSNKIELLKSWTAPKNEASGSGGLYVMNYDQLSRLLAAASIDPSSLHVDLVVCDEGHQLKSPKRLDTKVIGHISTSRRLILTGTPLQNHLREYFVMINLSIPKYFPQKFFFEFFIRPIDKSLSVGASAEVTRIARRRTYALIQEVNNFIQRRDETILAHDLPPLNEYIVVVPLSDQQAALYDEFIRILRKREKRGINILQAFAYASKISAHPQVLYDYHAIAKRTDLQMIDDDDDVAIVKSEQESLTTELMTLSRPPPQYTPRPEDSVKLAVALDLARGAVDLGEKVLIFSMSTKLLDFFEKMLVDSGHSKLQSFFRIDGKCSLNRREEQIQAFQQRPVNDAAPFICEAAEGPWVFLISTKAGGVGLTLTAASRIVILDCTWNPADDRQAIGRAYRYGQTRPVSVYRLVGRDTMEQRIYDQKVAKEWLFYTVVDSEVLRRDKLRGHKLRDLLLRNDASSENPFDQETDSCCAADVLLSRVRSCVHRVHVQKTVHMQDPITYGDDEKTYYESIKKGDGILAQWMGLEGDENVLTERPPHQTIERHHDAAQVYETSLYLHDVINRIIQNRREWVRPPWITQKRRPYIRGPGASRDNAYVVDDNTPNDEAFVAEQAPQPQPRPSSEDDDDVVEIF